VAKKPARKTTQKPAQKPVVILPWVLLTRWWAPPKAFGLALATQVMSYRKRYDNGERVYVLHALDACLNNGYLPEPWMLKGLWDAVTALDDGADPNEAFAFALSKGKHVGSNRKKRQDTFPILFRIYDLHCNEGLALDESEGGAFRTVAKEFPYGTRTIRRIHDGAPEALKCLLSRGVRKATPEDPKPSDE
jgi:hypothetical protein